MYHLAYNYAKTMYSLSQKVENQDKAQGQES